MSITGDSAIINAEKKMGFSLGSSPWIIQLYLLGFTLGPLIAGLGISRYLAGSNQAALAASPGQGVIFAGVIYGSILVFLLQTYALAHASKWFELSYVGDESDADWSHTFRFKNAIDLGEAVPLPVPPNAPADAKPKWVSQKWGVPRPNLKQLGHCWEISLYDKTLPLFLAWLPVGETFETCFSFKNHSVQAWCRTLPFQIEDGTRGTFIRTSWTKEPGLKGAIIPIGVFSHNDYIARKLKLDLEPLTAPKEEAQALAQTRDNYYRHGLAMELEMKTKQIEHLEKQLDKVETVVEERVGAIIHAMNKDDSKQPDRTGIRTSRRQQLIILGVAIVIIVAGAFIYFSGAHH